MKVTQSCLTLCDHMNYNPPVSSVHEISQAKILEWGAFPPQGYPSDPAIEHTSPQSHALIGRFFIS